VEIAFPNTRLAKLFSSEKELVRKFGNVRAKLIMKRMAEITAAENLQLLTRLPQIRPHELVGNLKGKISLDLKDPYRLLVEPDYEKIPRKEDGGLDWGKIEKVVIIGVEDTHG